MEPRSGSIASLTGPTELSGPSSLHGDSMATKKNRRRQQHQPARGSRCHRAALAHAAARPVRRVVDDARRHVAGRAQRHARVPEKQPAEPAAPAGRGGLPDPQRRPVSAGAFDLPARRERDVGLELPEDDPAVHGGALPAHRRNRAAGGAEPRGRGADLCRDHRQPASGALPDPGGNHAAALCQLRRAAAARLYREALARCLPVVGAVQGQDGDPDHARVALARARPDPRRRRVDLGGQLHGRAGRRGRAGVRRRRQLCRVAEHRRAVGSLPQRARSAEGRGQGSRGEGFGRGRRASRRERPRGQLRSVKPPPPPAAGGARCRRTASRSPTAAGSSARPGIPRSCRCRRAAGSPPARRSARSC